MGSENNMVAVCTIPPAGWRCTREAGHSGACAAVPAEAAPSIEDAWRSGFAAAEEVLGAHGSEWLLGAIENAWAEYAADRALARSSPGFAYRSGYTANTDLAPQSLAPAGGDQPHNNRQPVLGMNFCIALQGVFPPRG